MMKKLNAALLLLMGVGILLNFFRQKFYPNPNEIVVDGHRVDKSPCLSSMSELFGKGVDSVKMCDCFIPKFYPLVKNDAAKLKKFEEVGLVTLEGKQNDSATQILRDCVLENLADTAYKLDLKKFRNAFLQKFNDSIKKIAGWERFNIDSLGNCLFERMDGHITIKQYFSDDYMKVDVLREAILNCVQNGLENR